MLQPTDYPIEPDTFDNPREDAELAISLLGSVCDLHPDVTPLQRAVLQDAVRVLRRLAE